MDKLIGQVFGRLTVVEKVITEKKEAPKYKCLCTCGVYKVIVKNSFVSGHTSSCGCLRLDRITKHGKAKGHKTREYRIWEGIQRRCNNPNSTDYAKYGALGIKCEFSDFNDFYDYLGPIAEGLTVDRIDSTKNYCKGNVRLADMGQQAMNRRKRRDSATSYKGVRKREGRNYEASITLNKKLGGKTIRLGTFVDEWDAAQAYNKAAVELFGQFALLNVRKG